jgi:hypothetical protein
LLTTGHLPSHHPVGVGRGHVMGGCICGAVGGRGGTGHGPQTTCRGSAVLRRHWTPTPCLGAAPCGQCQSQTVCGFLSVWVICRGVCCELCPVVWGVGGAGAGLYHMSNSQWSPVIGDHPRQHQTRCPASPVQFFLTYSGELSVSWVGILLDLIGGVEIKMWEGCYPTFTLARHVG